MRTVNPRVLSVKLLRLSLSLLIAIPLLSACFGPDLPGAPQMPKLPSPRDLPGVDELLDQLPGFDLDLLDELDLPDLSDIADLPQLVDLPIVDVAENAIAFTGPTEMRIEIGEFIRGTDIQLTEVVDGRADSSSPACAQSASPVIRSTLTARGQISAASTTCCDSASIK